MQERACFGKDFADVAKAKLGQFLKNAVLRDFRSLRALFLALRYRRLDFSFFSKLKAD